MMVNNVKIPVASDDEVKRFYKPSLKPRVGFSKLEFRSKTPPPRRINNPHPRSKTPQPKRNLGQQNRANDFPVTWNNFQPQSYMPWGICRKPTLDYFKVFGSKCFILNTKDYLTKFDPKLYEGVFLDEEEAIKVTEKKNLENNIEDETLEVNKIVNFKESKNHPLETFIGNLNQRTLRSQAQNQSNFFCFILTIEPKNVNEALKDKRTKWVYRNKLDENGVVSRNKARTLSISFLDSELTTIFQRVESSELQMGTFRETLAEGNEGALHLGPERPRVYSDLSPEEKERTIWDNVDAHSKGRQNRGQGNNARGAGAAGYGGAQNRVGNANPAQENGVALDEEHLLFIEGGQDNAIDEEVDEQPIQVLALNVDNVFQADDYDAFNSDVDEAPTAQTMFMANLSSADPIYDEDGPSYYSDILSEVHDHDHYQDAICEHHEEHKMHDDVQPNYAVDSHANYTSDSNMIPL
ncbi:hypothetical protein Tco_1556284 [Tanacetum coccineum]